MTKTGSKLGRRGFLKGAVVSGVAGVAASSRLVSAQKQATPQAACKYSWEVAPAPIPAGEIKNEVTTDVVVVGAGVAGIVTALSAAEGGAKVVVIEKMKTFSARGFDVAAVDSRVQKKMASRLTYRRPFVRLSKTAINRSRKSCTGSGADTAER